MEKKTYKFQLWDLAIPLDSKHRDPYLIIAVKQKRGYYRLQDLKTKQVCLREIIWFEENYKKSITKVLSKL